MTTQTTGWRADRRDTPPAGAWREDRGTPSLS